MIPCKPEIEPAAFDRDCRKPGKEWLKTHPGATRPKDFWSRFKPDLAAVFHDLCAYTAIYEPVGTVDHYMSWDKGGAAYEWTNYRYAAGWVNSSKRTADDQILDPFEVGEDWFEILLPSLQLELTDKVPVVQRPKAEVTLDRLHLRHDERVLRSRESWFALFRSGELTLQGLGERAPLIARAVEKRVHEHVKALGRITTAQAASLCYLTTGRAKKLLAVLHERNNLRRSGRGRGVCFEAP